MADALDRFSPATREWFRGAFAAPTRVQEAAWASIAEGRHTLVVAPTGSGKTLAAFLWALDRLASQGASQPPILEPEDLAALESQGLAGEEAQAAAASAPRRRTRVVYLSPLKALGVDVERNLHAPLVGITQTARRLGLEAPRPSVGVRSGDTSAAERRQQLRQPPDILITTPESLFLMLTSQARTTLAGVETVILDEVHAVAGSKRGAHLALTLERLDALLERPAQRIGLSATVRPLEEVARFLGGGAPVDIVAPPSEKAFDLRVVVPVEDMSDIGLARAASTGDDPLAPFGDVADGAFDGLEDPGGAADGFGDGIAYGSASRSLRDPGAPPAGSIWPHIEASIVDRVLEHRSTIVFVNSRRLAERLTARLNEIYEERLAQAAEREGGQGASAGDEGDRDPAFAVDDGSIVWGGPARGGAGTDVDDERIPQPGSARRESRPTPSSRPSRPPAEVMAQSGSTKGADPVLARAHHGSVSKEARAEVEDALKTGRLRCVVATSSLELGIDMGDVELVIQVESPPSVASGLQRLGRAGHQVGVVSKGDIFPKHRADVLHSGVAATRMLSGSIEALRITANPLDVLAQQTIAATAMDELDVEEWFDLVRRAAPFASLPRSVFDATLDLLAGRYPSDAFAELRPRVVWDRDAGTLTARPGAQRLAVTSGGTIPDRGMFGVFLLAGAEGGSDGSAGDGPARPARTGGMRVGELDEEMVYESRVGDVFALGATSWRIAEITHDRVLVTPAFGEPGKLPFWTGDALGRPAELGEAIGAATRAIVRGMPAQEGPEALKARAIAAGGGDGDSDSDSAGSGSGSGSGAGSSSGGEPSGAGSASDDLGGLASVLDPLARGNLLAYLAEQRASTGHVPDDRTLVVERCRDELGDWRVILHSPYGKPVHSPWALIVNARISERYGVDGGAVASDDGIIVRLPDAEADPPGAELFALEPDEIEPIVAREVGGSALFAARFREAAARALLLPRLHPGKRSPLWQQRQKAAQLLDVAKGFPTFPIILETVREVLHDVYDLDALTELAKRLERREVRLVETATEEPSPFARTMLFGYVGAFMYEGDSPLAERRAAALSLDAGLLAELLGRVELRELLDAGVIERVERELQRLAPGRRARDLEGVADLLRLLGPLSVAEIAARLEGPDDGEAVPVSDASAGVAAGAAGAVPGHPLPNRASAPDIPAADVRIGSEHETGALEAADSPAPGAPDGPDADAARAAALLPLAEAHVAELVAAKRALRVRIAGEERIAAIEDASRLRDALGVPLPIGVPSAFIEPVADPVGDLVSRYARTHGPFRAAELASRMGLGEAIAREALSRLELARRVVEGEFRPGASGSEWIDQEILRRIRARSLAALRSEVEPVDQPAFARFLASWQHLEPSRGKRPASGELAGVDGLVTAIDQLAGCPVPASALESFILPARVRDYGPWMLDELAATGELRWVGHGPIPGGDGWVSLHLADTAHLTLPLEPEDPPAEPDALGLRVLDALERGGARFFRELQRELELGDDGPLARAIWELVWQGRVTNDAIAPLRGLLSGGPGGTSGAAHRAPRRAARGRLYRGRVAMGGEQQGSAAFLPAPPSLAGRWSLAPSGDADAGERAIAAGELLLDRHGVVTRGAVTAEGLPGGFALAYRVLARFEESGRARRGYYVEGLGGAQFATSGTIDRLRSFSRDPGETPPREAITLAATDPANPYGAALAWPEPPGEETATGHRPGRKAGGLVTLVDGELALYVERGGKTLLAFTDDDAVLGAATESLARTVERARIPNLVIEKANGAYVHTHPIASWLDGAGFQRTPRGFKARTS
ncbi:ATP-dependent RNA helicase RhlE [Pseudoclavibacter triregionum]|nr:ATP-dependent RNA helicase RhlE [Pseudoclavibacter triregionum]